VNTKLAAILPSLQRLCASLAAQLFGRDLRDGNVTVRLLAECITIAVVVRQGSIQRRRHDAVRRIEGALDDEGFDFEMGPADREIAFYVVGKSGMPLSVEELIARNRTRKPVDLPPGAAPSAKSPGGPERREAWKQEQAAADARATLEIKAATWARDLDPNKWTGVRRCLVDRLDRGVQVEECTAFLDALDRVIAEAGRWTEIEDQEPANDRAA
jgi:hypothetical protein